jgi:hypothetical protein
MIWRIASVPFLLGDLDVKHGIPKIWGGSRQDSLEAYLIFLKFNQG